MGSPEIVIEILSPSDSTIELKNKYEIYEEAAIKEYWIVFPNNRTFLVYTLGEGKYKPPKLLVAGDIFTSTELNGFLLYLNDMFNNINKYFFLVCISK